MIPFYETTNGFFVEAHEHFFKFPVFISIKQESDIENKKLEDIITRIPNKQWKKIEAGKSLPLLESKEKLLNVFTRIHCLKILEEYQYGGDGMDWDSIYPM